MPEEKVPQDQKQKKSILQQLFRRTESSTIIINLLEIIGVLAGVGSCVIAFLAFTNPTIFNPIIQIVYPTTTPQIIVVTVEPPPQPTVFIPSPQIIEVTRIVEVEVTQTQPPSPPSPTPFSIQVNAEQVGIDTKDLFKVVLTHIDILPNDKSRWYFDFVNNSGIDYCFQIEKDFTYVTDTDTLTAYNLLDTSLPYRLTIRTLSKESFYLDFNSPVVSNARNFAVRLTPQNFCTIQFKIFDITLNY